MGVVVAVISGRLIGCNRGRSTISTCNIGSSIVLDCPGVTVRVLDNPFPCHPPPFDAAAQASVTAG
jgi:hypothetical protein